jgi:hypothetical protein
MTRRHAPLFQACWRTLLPTRNLGSRSARTSSHRPGERSKRYAAARDELRDGIPVDVVLDALAGAVFFHLGLVGAPATPALVDTLTTLFIEGIRAR